MDFQTIATTIVGVLAPIGTAAAALWRWLTKQLEECKAKHTESLDRIESLHKELRTLSEDVGNLQGQLTVYQASRKNENKVDSSTHPG